MSPVDCDRERDDSPADGAQSASEAGWALALDEPLRREFERSGAVVTREMIDAGVRVYRDWLESSEWDYRIFMVRPYRSMHELAPQR
jgi:hypothetical protein